MTDSKQPKAEPAMSPIAKKHASFFVLPGTNEINTILIVSSNKPSKINAEISTEYKVLWESMGSGLIKNCKMATGSIAPKPTKSAIKEKLFVKFSTIACVIIIVIISGRKQRAIDAYTLMLTF